MKFNLISALLRRFNKAFTKMRRRRRRMLVLILILPFLGVFCDPCPKASPAFTEKVFRLGFRDMALGIHFMDDKTGWAVGSFGLAMKTEDGGENWQKVPISEEHYLKDVFFFGKKGWMVGELGVILSTNDGGKKWSEQKSNVGQSLLSVFFINENTGFTVGGDGTMLKTNNGGASWDLIDMSWPALIPDELLELGTVSINLYDVFFLNETIGWIVGDAGTVLRTGDGGKEWILAQMGDLKPLFSVFFKNDKQGWAVGSHGFSQKSNDGGQSWERLDLNTENSLYKVTINKDSGIMVGDLATIFKTDNGGETWVKAPNNLPPPYPWFADAWVLPTAPVKTMVVGKSMILSLEQ